MMRLMNIKDLASKLQSSHKQEGNAKNVKESDGKERGETYGNIWKHHARRFQLLFTRKLQ
jgi:hypothetical protein